jgi:hypothetical protein
MQIFNCNSAEKQSLPVMECNKLEKGIYDIFIQWYIE